MSKSKPQILFLFSDTGGGHRAATDAIIEAIDLEFPGQVITDKIDVLKNYFPSPMNKAPEVYPQLSKMPRMWEMGYKISDGKKRVQLTYKLFGPYFRWYLDDMIMKYPVDLFVSVHQLINEPVARVVHEYGIKFATVVTDLVSTHAAWFTPEADLITVPTQTAYERGLEMNISPEKLFITGQPVADRFCQPVADKPTLREKMGWKSDLPTVLLVGGGEGMGPLEAVAKAIDASRLPLELVIVAGRNKRLQAKLSAHPWNIPVKIYGFVTEMPEMMRASDILITKAGPGTIAEAFIAGLPVILYSKMPGQEDGNVTYVEIEQAGVWAPTPEEVVSALTKCIEDPSVREKYSINATRLANPLSSRRIARLLVELASE